MTALLRAPLAAALALGLAAAPHAQVDADVPGAAPATAALQAATVDVDDRDPGAAPFRAAPLRLEATVSDADVDALRSGVAAPLPMTFEAATGPLDDGREGAAPAVRLRVAFDGPLDDGRGDGLAPTFAALRAPYDGPLDDGRPAGARRPVMADEADTPAVAATGPVARAEAPVEGLSLSLVRPNPARDRAELTFALEAAGTATLRVYDVQGREVAVAFDAAAPADTRQTVSLDVEALAPGTYVAVLSAHGQRASQTFQVVR